jgi:release factor glutamine methyltransferase
MTVMEALRWANNKLRGHLDVDKRSGDVLDSPMLDAEVLLANQLDVSKAWLFGHFDKELEDEQLEAFRKAVERRMDHEPVAYITGEKEFYSRAFVVNRSTLVPRPETELLVEEAVKIAGKQPSNGLLFADVGTGSGAIAVTLAAETSRPIAATDIDVGALTVARQNAQAHDVDDLIEFRHGNLLEPVRDMLQSTDDTYEHLVVCANLPYLADHQWREGQKELHFEPKTALVAGPDGLDAYWNLFKQLQRHRADFPETVMALLEIDPSQRESIKPLIKHRFPHAEIIIKNDLAGRARLVVVEV